MFDSPDNAIHEQFELIGRDAQQRCGSTVIHRRHRGAEVRTRETIQIDSTQEFEEPDTMFREFGKILIDHAQRGLEDRIQDSRYLWRE
jgi:hypothetical protein